MCIDEIHKYKELNVVFMGSSVLDIKKGAPDLSRRAVINNIQGLSFREYLNLFHQITVKTFTLEEILEHKVEIPGLPHPLPSLQTT